MNRPPPPPLPFAAAQVYAGQVGAWARLVPTAGLRCQHGLAYGPHPAQRCDVIAPAAAANAPILVFWHGGGWTNGEREWVHFMAPAVAGLGIVLVAPSYRLAHEARLPAAADDAAEVIRWLQLQAASSGGDAQRLYLAGHSAGGHLAALTALRTGPGSGIRGCLPISAIMDLQHPAPPPGSLEERVYTMVLADPQDDASMSPLCWCAGNRIPFDLSWGEMDSERVRRSNTRMHRLLQQQAAPVQATMIAGADHFSTHTGLIDAGHDWYRRLQRMVESTA
jgi:acetyl esterase/lipase